MGLADLINNGISGKVATAIPATPATDKTEVNPTVATVATVAVAASFIKKHLPDLLQKLADESAKRFDFCEMHRQLIGGNCERFNVIEQLKRGDRTAALAGCLLWRLVSVGREIERAGAADVAPGITVADVLKWVRHEKDIDAIRKDRRTLLACTQGTQRDSRRRFVGETTQKAKVPRVRRCGKVLS